MSSGKETDPERRKKGFSYVQQREVVQCPNDETHGQCEVFESRAGDLFHKCPSCVDQKERTKDGDPNPYFGKPGVIVCKDGESDKRKRGGGKWAAVTASKVGKAGSGSRDSPDRGVQHVDRRKQKEAMLLDMQQKQDQIYQMLLQLVKPVAAQNSVTAAVAQQQ